MFCFFTATDGNVQKEISRPLLHSSGLGAFSKARVFFKVSAPKSFVVFKLRPPTLIARRADFGLYYNFFSSKVSLFGCRFYFLLNYARFCNFWFFSRILNSLLYESFRFPAFSMFLLVYYFFLIYKAPILLFSFFANFFKFYSYKLHNYFKKFLEFLFESTTESDLFAFKIRGIFIKFTGKIASGGGDRRRSFSFRLGRASVADSLSRYEIYCGDLLGGGGVVGCVIILSVLFCLKITFFFLILLFLFICSICA